MAATAWRGNRPAISFRNFGTPAGVRRRRRTWRLGSAARALLLAAVAAAWMGQPAVPAGPKPQDADPPDATETPGSPPSRVPPQPDPRQQDKAPAGAGTIQAEEAAFVFRSQSGIGAIIPIDTEITDVTTASLKRRLDDARRAGADVVIFEMNTPGGMVSSALDISHLIKNIRDLHTVAWINTQAYSAGALISVACNEIVMSPASTLGDVQVIFGSPVGVEAVPEELAPKVNTPILAEFRASASLRGYDQVLCEAFVIPEREVWWLEHKTTGQREFVFQDEKEKRLGREDDDSATHALLDSFRSPPQWKLVEKYFDIVSQREVNALQPVDRADQLLQMSASEAHAYGFNKAVIADEHELAARYGVSSLPRYGSNWSESLTLWLTSSYVRGFLLIMIFLGAYVEFHTPGVGLAGLVALICLAIFAGAPYLTGLANVWEIAVILVGFVLIAVEVFVIPGFGIAGISGIVLVLVGLLATFVPDEPGRYFPWQWPGLGGAAAAIKTGIITLTAALALSIVGMVFLSRRLPQVAMFRSVFPPNPTAADVAPKDDYAGTIRIGDVGRAEGPLRPAGKARFGSVLADVVSEGGYVEAGAVVEIIDRRGNVVTVRAV